MSDRLKPRQTIEDPDSQLISSFGGLSSASYNRTGDIVYQDKLVNAYVNKRGEISKRSGSLVNTSIAYFDGATGNGAYKFTFDDTKYMLAKVGSSLVLTATKDNVGYIAYRTYTGLLANKSANDKPSFAVRIEGNYCHVLVATANSQMVDIVIVKSIISSPSVSGTTVTGKLQVPIAGNTINNGNTILRQDNTLVQPGTVVHNDADISITTSVIPTLNISKPIRLHSFFVLRFCDAQYYPGLYLVNTALRRNQVPLDVNVQVPQELQSNPIVNEPTQLVDRETLWVYGSNTKRNKVTNRQPANGNEWDFSDGGYFTGSGLFTNPSSSFISFGGYSPASVNGSNTTVTMHRLRRVLVNGLTGNIRVAVDKVNRTPVYHDVNTNVISANGVRPVYFSFVAPDVNLNLSAVVETIDTSTTLNGILDKTTIVNLDANDGSISIGDGFCIPLYGYSFNIRNGVYPDAVAFVGNRLVLSSKDSRVVFSHADWNYRGISFNNCQISTINFSETSAFSVNIGQGTSNIRAFKSVNGVVAVGTDNGVFRISSSASANRPPNAADAIVSRVSSEIVPNADSFAVFDNRIFYISNNGLYALEYSEQVAELVNQSMSTNVSDKFTTANSVSYVDELRSFLITQTDTNEILAFNVDTESYYSIKFATNAKPQVYDDCFFFTIADESSQHMLICSFSKNESNDLSNFNNFSYLLPGRSLTISSQPTDVSSLVCPAELLTLLAPTQRIALASGDNHVRLVGNDSTTIVEYISGLQSLPVDAYVVSKGFYGGRLDQSSRIASVDLMLAGVGSIAITIVHPTNDYVDRAASVELWQFTNDNYQGEQMANAAYPMYSIRASAGDTNVVKLRQLGISESWQLALKLTGVRLLGMQFITNVKSRKRLR